MFMSSRGRFANGVGLLLRRRPVVVEDIHGPWEALLAGRGSLPGPICLETEEDAVTSPPWWGEVLSMVELATWSSLPLGGLNVATARCCSAAAFEINVPYSIGGVSWLLSLHHMLFLNLSSPSQMSSNKIRLQFPVVCSGRISPEIMAWLEAGSLLKTGATTAGMRALSYSTAVVGTIFAGGGVEFFRCSLVAGSVIPRGSLVVTFCLVAGTEASVKLHNHARQTIATIAGDAESNLLDLRLGLYWRQHHLHACREGRASLKG